MKIEGTKDYQLIAKLNKPIQDLHAKLEPELFKPHNFDEISEFFRGVVEKHNHYFFIAMLDEEPIGYIWLEIVERQENPFRMAYKSLHVVHISLNEFSKNKGYGTKLMSFVEDFAKRNSIGKIELDYWNNNEDAKNFYKKLGFKLSRELVYKEID